MSTISTRKTQRPRPGVVPKQPVASSPVRNWLLAILTRLALLASLSALVVGGGLIGFTILQPPPRVSGSVSLELVPTLSVIDAVLVQPTATPTPLPPPEVAILAGHWSKPDPEGVATIHDTGAICPDGLREVTINKAVADELQAQLIKRGYRVALLEEFDARLKRDAPDLAPTVFLAIHADSCVGGPEYPLATGFKIAHAVPSQNPDDDERLVGCLRRDYQKAVDPFKLTFNQNTITNDMTEYHAFREIVPTTPAAIIELGFMNNDRNILTKHQEELARGLTLGLDSFLRGDHCGVPTPSPTDAPNA